MEGERRGGGGREREGEGDGGSVYGDAGPLTGLGMILFELFLFVRPNFLELKCKSEQK